MPKRSTRSVVLGLALVGGLLAAGPAIPAEVALATSVDQARREVERVVDELERLEERSDRLTEDYAEAVDEKGQLEIEVAAAEERVAAMQAQLAELRDDLATVAVRKYTGATDDVLGPLFTDATVYNDNLQRDQLSRVALSVGTTTANDYEQLSRDLADEQASLERARAQVEALAERLEGQLVEAEQLRERLRNERAAAEARLGEAIRAEEQRRLEEARRRMEAEAAAAAAAAAQSQQSSGGGGGGGGGTPTPAAPASGGGGGGGGSSTPAPAPVTNVPAPSGLAGVAVSAALAQQGVPYKFASSQPGVAFDCSGLTHYAWGQAGVYLPRNSRAQAASIPRVPQSQAQPGDLIFYYSPISHVGIYLGNGQLVHAPNSGSVVSTTTVNWSRVTAVGRPG